MDRRADLSRQPTPRGTGDRDSNKQLLGQMSRIQLQMFPLAARRRELQKFCDKWFNDHIPPEVAWFQPALPMVICTILHYEELGTELMWQTGTMTQNELYFLVPMDCYRLENGRLQFVEHCATTPYIFVDNSPSAVAGRERFGFPKQACSFNTPLLGALGAGAAERFLSVSSWVPSTSGHAEVPLLDVVREPFQVGGVAIDRPLSAPDVAPRPGVFERLNAFWTLQTLAGEWRARTNPGPPGEIRGQVQELLASLSDGFGLSVYNFRQFAHPRSRGGARYQDLVRFRMRVNGVQDMRLFSERYGPANYSLLMHRRAVVPVADRLGLDVFSRQRGSVAEGRPTVDVLHTYMPMFAQADVELADTKRVCWRFQNSGWHDDAGTAITRPTSTAFARYNDFLGPSTHAFMDQPTADKILDQKIMMLPARAQSVSRYVEAMVPPGCPVKMTALTSGDYAAVRLVLSQSRKQRVGDQEDLLWLDGAYASVAVPVRYEIDGETEQAMLVVKEFTDNAFLLQMLRELSACPTDHGELRGDDWFSASQDVARLLSVDAVAIERNATEALLTETRVFDVFSVDRTTHPDVLREAVTAPIQELWPLVAGALPVVSFGFIPDPGYPEHALMRRFVRTAWHVANTVDTEPPRPGRDLFVHFHHTETYPLVEDLGLVCLPHDRKLAMRLRQGSKGRTHTVPAVKLDQAGVAYDRPDIHVLWQERYPSAAVAARRTRQTEVER